MSNKIVCERFVQSHSNYLMQNILENKWYDIVTKQFVDIYKLINEENYIIVDVKTSNSIACSDSANTRVVFDHTILTLQKES